MSETARAWLAANALEVPPLLQARMEAAAQLAGPGALHAELADAAVDCLRVALDRCDDRAAALHLLAADALVTYACAHGASDGVEAIDELCAALSPARLHAIIAHGDA